MIYQVMKGKISYIIWNFIRLFSIVCHWRKAKHMVHDGIIKWKHFPRYWSFVRGIHRSPVNSPHKGQWPGALMYSLICPWTNSWVNSRDAGDLRRNRAHYDVNVMLSSGFVTNRQQSVTWVGAYQHQTSAGAHRLTQIRTLSISN